MKKSTSKRIVLSNRNLRSEVEALVLPPRTKLEVEEGDSIVLKNGKVSVDFMALDNKQAILILMED